ncbi:hypothetical protein GCM10022378_11150 [Salinicoccus jeotgali]|uniref:HTH cro/C1-type domain-containing protein n=1 Tax=Salinicoccus jeotgali TaxID=381634 RepID=A0ABP7ERM6_9STAP
MSVSDNIKKYRKMNNLLQKQLADKIGVSSQVISNWERGYTNPNYEDVIKLSDALDCSTDDLLGKRKELETPLDDVDALMFSDKEGFDNLSEEDKQELRELLNDQLEYWIDKKNKGK